MRGSNACAVAALGMTTMTMTWPQELWALKVVLQPGGPRSNRPLKVCVVDMKDVECLDYGWKLTVSDVETTLGSERPLILYSYLRLLLFVLPGKGKRSVIEDDGHAGGDDDGDDFEGGSGGESEGGEDDVDDDDDGDNGATGLDKRRMTRAAGDHPLQSQLRSVLCRLTRFHAEGNLECPDGNQCWLGILCLF